MNRLLGIYSQKIIYIKKKGTNPLFNYLNKWIICSYPFSLSIQQVHQDHQG